MISVDTEDSFNKIHNQFAMHAEPYVEGYRQWTSSDSRELILAYSDDALSDARFWTDYDNCDEACLNDFISDVFDDHKSDCFAFPAEPALQRAAYVAGLSDAGCKLFSSLLNGIEAAYGCSPEEAAKLFASDYFNSNPSVNLGDLRCCTIDTKVFEIVDRCSPSELGLVTKLGTDMSLCERLAAGATIFEEYDESAGVSVAVYGSESLLIAINNFELPEKLLSIFSVLSGIGYYGETLAVVIDKIRIHPHADKIIRVVKNGTICSASDLDFLLKAAFAESVKSRRI